MARNSGKFCHIHCLSFLSFKADPGRQKGVSSPAPLTTIPPPSRTSLDTSKPYPERANLESGHKPLRQDLTSNLNSEDVVGQNQVSLCQILSQITISTPNPRPLQSYKAYQNSKTRPRTGLQLQSRWKNMNSKSKKDGLEDLETFQENFRETGDSHSMISAATEPQDMTSKTEQSLQTTRNPQLIGKLMVNFFKEFEQGKQKRSLTENPLCTEIWIIILREVCSISFANLSYIFLLTSQKALLYSKSSWQEIQCSCILLESAPRVSDL